MSNFFLSFKICLFSKSIRLNAIARSEFFALSTWLLNSLQTLFLLIWSYIDSALARFQDLTTHQISAFAFPHQESFLKTRFGILINLLLWKIEETTVCFHYFVDQLLVLQNSSFFQKNLKPSRDFQLERLLPVFTPIFD